MMPALTALREQLAAVPGVATCRIGMEADLRPSDYPMVRLVPASLTDSRVIGRRRCELTVYFGQPIEEFDGGLEAQYASLFEMESALLTAAQATPDVWVQYVETVLDEDRVDAYKLMALRLVVEGQA